MAEQTMLQIVQDVCRRQGLQVPSVVTTSTDETVLQLWGLLNEEAEELPTRGPWQQLRTPATFSYSTDANYQAFDPTTLAGYKNIVRDTLWNETARLPVIGPVPDEVWQAMLSMSVSQAQDSFKMEQDLILIYPGHTVANDYSFRYQSCAGVLSSVLGPGSTPIYQFNFLTDDDTPRLPTRIIKAGLRWRWRREKGQPYAEEMRSYEVMIADELSLTEAASGVSMDNTRTFNNVAGPGLLIAAGSWPL